MHAFIIAACLWPLYLWTMATPGLVDRNGNVKGTDFLHFYTLGSFAAAHRGADLYDMKAAEALVSGRVPAATGKRYLPLYPPQVSLLFLPLAYLAYPWALAVWWCCSGVLYAICCYSVWRCCGNLQDQGLTVVLAALAFPAFFHLIAWGQTSALALACFTGTFLLLRQRRQVLAGLVLGCLIFKPQLGLAAAIVFALSGAWRVVLGAFVSATAQLAAGVLYFGVEPLRVWLVALRTVPTQWRWLEPRPYQTHSLRTFWAILIPWGNLALPLYVVSAVFVLAIAVSMWRRKQTVPLELRFSALLLATVLVAPHLTVYDLVILAPALLLTSDWLVGTRIQSRLWHRLGLLLYLVYVLPLVSPIVQWSHLQLSVIAMAATVYVIWRAAQLEQINATPR